MPPCFSLDQIAESTHTIAFDGDVLTKLYSNSLFVVVTSLRILTWMRDLRSHVKTKTALVVLILHVIHILFIAFQKPFLGSLDADLQLTRIVCFEKHVVFFTQTGFPKIE